MKGIYALVLLLLVVGVRAQNKKLAIIGSSTSACYGVAFTDCYVYKLDSFYDAIGQPIDIFQLAQNGNDVYNGMPSSYTPPPGFSSPDPLRNITAAVNVNPNVILVNFPSNNFNIWSVASIMFAFRTIRDSANAAGKVAFITTTQPRTTFDAAGRARLKEIKDSILAQFGSFAINFWDGLADPDGNILPAYDHDGTHFNAEGHKILFQRVRDANIFAAALPIKLRSFNATSQQSKVNITWTVAEESPGTRYEVQRSTDGASFQAIYTAISAGTAANRSYNTTDATAAPGIYYYRLKVTENARSFFSQVVKLTLVKNKLSLTNFSVDAAHHQLIVKMEASGPARMQLNFINSTGQLVQKNIQLLQPGENRLSIPLTAMPAGTYWAEAISDQQKIFTKGFRVY